MRTLASKIRAKLPDGSSIIPSDIFTSIGNLTFEQLSTLRHRGAFSTVSLTFARFCQLTQYLTSDASPTLLETYYQVRITFPKLVYPANYLRGLWNVFLSKHQQLVDQLESQPSLLAYCLRMPRFRHFRLSWRSWSHFLDSQSNFLKQTKQTYLKYMPWIAWRRSSKVPHLAKDRKATWRTVCKFLRTV